MRAAEREPECPRAACPQMLDCITFPCDICPVWDDSLTDDEAMDLLAAAAAAQIATDAALTEGGATP